MTNSIRIPRGSIRSQALNRVAALSLKGPVEHAVPAVNGSATNGHINGSANGTLNGSAKVTPRTGLPGDLLKLANAVAREDVSSVAISHKELEIIFALCNAAPAVRTEQQASDLIAVLSPYFLESSSQKFKSHASLQLGPSPWDYLTKTLADAMIALTNKYASLSTKTETSFKQFLSKFSLQEEQPLTAYFSLLGFLKSLISTPSLLDQSMTQIIVELFNAEFLDRLESVTMKALEDEHDFTYLLAYKATSDEFNSLLFAHLVQKFFNRVLLTLASRDFENISPQETDTGLIGHLLLVNSSDYDDEPDVTSQLDKLKTIFSRHIELIKVLCRKSSAQIDELDHGSTYINISSPERVTLAMRTKGLALQVLAAGLVADIIPSDVMTETVRSSLAHPSEAVDTHISPVVISIGALLTYKGQKVIISDLIHSFPLLVSKITPDASTAFVKSISKCFALGLKPLDEDSIVTTIYSLVNLLVSENGAPVNALRELRLRSATNTFNSKTRASRSNTLYKLVQTESATSLKEQTSENSHVFRNAITSALEIAKVYDDDSITVLTVTILSQKFLTVSRELDFYLLDGLSDIATHVSEKEFLALLKSFDAGMYRDDKDQSFINAIVATRVKIAKALEGKFSHPLHDVYITELLQSVVALGDVQNKDHRSQGEISEIAVKIARYIPPLAQLLPKGEKLEPLSNSMVALFQNFWFNIAVHGYSETAKLTKQLQKFLEVIALNSPPLASDAARAHTEASFELNTVLRRGSSNHNVKDQQHIIAGVSNTNSLELKTLSYSKLMFLSATSLLENLRANIGDCSTILHYFADPAISKANIEKFIGSIAISVVQKFSKLTITAHSPYFTSDNAAAQLTKILILCVHRNYDLQDAAFQCATALMHKLPTTLCNRTSLYTLLDLLTTMYESHLDAERSKYQPQRELTLRHSKVKITVSDSVKWKRSTLDKLIKKAEEWCHLSLIKCNQDMRTLLMTYVSDLALFNELSPVDFGISFALRMAGTILSGDAQSSSIVKTNALAGFLTEYGWKAQNLGKTRGELDDYAADPNEHPLLTAIRAQKRALSFESEWTKRIGLSDQESREDLSYMLFAEIVVGWQRCLSLHEGLFSRKHDLKDEGFLKMEYIPSDQAKVDYYANLVIKNLEVDTQVISFLASHFQGTLYQSEHMLHMFTDVVFDALEHLKVASLHPYARAVRFKMIKFALDVLAAHFKIGSKIVSKLFDAILDGALSWFVQYRPYPFGDNDLKSRADMDLMIDVFDELRSLTIPAGRSSRVDQKRRLLLTFLFDEINKSMIWLSPRDPVEFKGEVYKADSKVLAFAYKLDPSLAFSLVARTPGLEKDIATLVTQSPSKALSHYQSVQYLLKDSRLSRYLILAQPISPTESINLFTPPYINDPYVTQYTMRALEAQDINLTFFYVPQIVQGLNNDKFGYVARFIVEVSKVSQKFSHQLIWNLLANSENEVLDTETMIASIVDSYDDEAKAYYDREFGFFNEVTDISGKLRPYLKNTKAEKKVKIDEEMAKIVVLDDVYLPSNPDGVVVDINRTSGKPLQSHAKTPFMATFRIRKDQLVNGRMLTVEKWQSAIFKVGDDVRQDVLALQLIAIFKSVWENAGLDMYCFPNRVTATAPGCGVIDVLPNSISRDMLGREAVNDLYTYFKAKFPDGNLEFEDAVQNFVKSLAAYSIISYLLQFKDRHNGNIMYDDKGHILHIDFGFCFDIVPGGVKFEACPFKLTKEMVRVMGGSNNTEYFHMFEELFIKGFLAMRPHHELIIGNVQSMLASGLPCFKGEKTIRNLRHRFFLNKNDKECIKALKGLIRESYESIFSVGYDKFQKMTNGIPY